jgi:hypothetical protein
MPCPFCQAPLQIPNPAAQQQAAQQQAAQQQAAQQQAAQQQAAQQQAAQQQAAQQQAAQQQAAQQQAAQQQAAQQPTPQSYSHPTGTMDQQSGSGGINIGLIAAIGGGVVGVGLVVVLLVMFVFTGNEPEEVATNPAGGFQVEAPVDTEEDDDDESNERYEATESNMNYKKARNRNKPNTITDPPPSPPRVKPNRVVSGPTDLPPPNPPRANPPTPSSTDTSASPTQKGAFEIGMGKWWTKPRKGLARVKPHEPPSSQYSWMVGLLPHLGHQDVFDGFNFKEPWYAPRNQANCLRTIPEFLSPGDPRVTWKGFPFEGMALTHFVGMSGVEDQRNVVAAKLPRSDPRAGSFGYDEVLKPSQITDGKSETIMIIGAGNIMSPWVQGGGATIRGAREPYFDDVSGFGMPNLKTPGTVAMFADGSTRMISKDIDPSVFRAMCTAHGAENYDLSLQSKPSPVFPTRKIKR